MKRGAFYLTISTVIFLSSGYIINIWLGRHLGPALYGIYGVLTSLLTALNIMQVSGVPQAVSKFIAEKDMQADSILKSGLKIQLFSTIVLGLLFFSFAPLFSYIFRDVRFIGYTHAMALVFPLYGLFALYGGYYNGLHNFKRQALMNSAYSVAKLFLVVGLVLVFSLYGVIAGFILAPLIALLVGFHWPKRGTQFSARSLILFSIPLITFAVFSTLQLSIDLFSVKGMIHSPEVAGYYSAAQNIALVTFLGLSAIGQVLFPRISKLQSTGEQKEAKYIITKALRTLLLLVLPLTALIAGTAPGLVQLLFGQAYLPAVPILRVLVTGYIFLTIFAMFANILNGAGKARTTTLFAFIGLITGFAGCLILIPIWGATGAAVATGLGGLVAATAAMRATTKQFHYQLSQRSLFKILTGSLVVLGLGWGFQVSPILLPIWWLVLGILYAGWLVFSREINIDDWKQIHELLISAPKQRSDE